MPGSWGGFFSSPRTSRRSGPSNSSTCSSKASFSSRDMRSSGVFSFSFFSAGSVMETSSQVIVIASPGKEDQERQERSNPQRHPGVRHDVTVAPERDPDNA